MYRRTQILTLPEGSTATHWSYPEKHCSRFATEFAEQRLFGERSLSEDGRVWTSTQIWVSKEAWQAFADTPETREVAQLRDEYCELHGITKTIEDEEF
jgi:hypothetical protein